MVRRLILLGCIALVLAPGTWLRTPPSPADYEAGVTVASIMPSGKFVSDQVTLEQAWQLTSTNTHFGGYSGLVALDERSLLAGSDKARLLDLKVTEGGLKARQMRFLKTGLARQDDLDRELVDLEAITRDNDSGTLWAAYEFTQTIERHSPNGAIAVRDPPEMAGWPENGGPEVLQRLADGRFLVLAENSESWFADGTPGLLFGRDPIEKQDPIAFRFPELEGLSPVDAALLPDGKVMILLRDIRFSWPIRFRSALAIADPSAIEDGELWDAAIVARFSGPGLDANFEGLASVPRDDGGATIYVISDDNFSNLQETLVLRLSWTPGD